MRRVLRPREWPLIEAALAKAVGYGFSTERLAPAFRQAITVEGMNRNFVKYHLGRGFALHRFTGVDLGPPHDHPCGFQTLILEPYVEDIYAVQHGGWSCRRVLRQAGTVHAVTAETVHKIVALPGGQSWTLVQYGRHVRETRFYRFGDVIEARTRQQRKWRNTADSPSSFAA